MKSDIKLTNTALNKPVDAVFITKSSPPAFLKESSESTGQSLLILISVRGVPSQKFYYYLNIQYDECSNTSRDQVDLKQREVKDTLTRRDSL